MNDASKKNKKISLSSVKYAFKTIIWPRRMLLTIGIFLIFVNRISGLIIPAMSQRLIDDVISVKNVSLLNWILLFVGVSVLVKSVTSFMLTLLLSVEAQHLISQLRIKTQKHIIRLPLSFFDNQKSGALVSRIMNDVEGIRNLIGTGLVYLVGGVLTAIVSLVLLFRINVTLTLLTIVPLLLFSLVSLKAFTYLRPIFRKRWEISADVTGRLTESLAGVRVIKGFNAEDREEKVFSEGVERLFQNVRKTLTTTSFVTCCATLLMGVISLFTMGYGSHLIFQDKMTIGDFVAFTLYLGFLISPIIEMTNIGTQITEAFAGLDRMEEILNYVQEGKEVERQNNLDHIRGDIHFENVTFAYQEGKDVLKNITFNAPAGTVTALVGSSGSGKSTIASLVASFQSPKNGKIWVDDIDLNTVFLGSYRNQLGVVLQDEFLFEGTIRENILFARPSASEEELLAATRSAYVEEFVQRFELGLDTLIGERGVKLSGGQRQRVSIARAILANPRILILDEATSSLDTESEQYIQKSLEELLKGRTTFVIAHRLSTIRRADQILVIEKGEIVERGSHEELIGKEGRYHHLYTYQARI